MKTWDNGISLASGANVGIPIEKHFDASRP